MTDLEFTRATTRSAAQLLQCNDVRPFISLIAKELHPCRLYLVGGSLRDITRSLNGEPPATIHDLDFVVDGPCCTERLQTLRISRIRRNSFTGIAWEPNDSSFTFEFWPLDGTVSLVNAGLRPNLSNLLKTIDFNVNSVVYDLTMRRLYTQPSYFTSIRRQLLDFNTEPRFLSAKEITAARIVILASKTGYRLSSALTDFVIANASTPGQLSDVIAYLKHYSARYDRPARYVAIFRQALSAILSNSKETAA